MTQVIDGTSKVRWFKPAGAVTALMCAAMTWLAGCAAPTRTRGPEQIAAPPVQTAAQSADAALASLVDEYFERVMALYPTFATYLGDERYNDQLEMSATSAFSDQVIANERQYLERVKRIDPAQLTPSARVSHDIFVRERELALEGARFPDHLMPISQLDSMAMTIAVFGSGASAQPFRTARDYDNFLARAARLPQWVDDAIASMRAGIAAGITLPRPAIEKVISQLREIGAASVEDSVFWRPIQGLPEDVAAAERTRLTAAYRALIVDRLLPSYRRLADFIANDYVPRARTTVGWSALPDGQAWYRLRIRTNTTTTLDAETIHSLGLAEVARIRREMDAVRVQVGFAGDLPAFFKHLSTDPRFYFKSESDLLAAYRDAKRRIDALLPKLFVDFPKADYEVRAVEPFRAAASPGAFYQGPSADGKRPGIFYVNSYNLRAQPNFGVETLSLHEAAPGHHFQVAIQQELTDLPRFRRFNNYVAYAEGWALYAESIGKELGLFSDPYQWYGRLSDEMLRAMRLVVDTGLHAKGWSRDQAIRYMLDNSSMAESDVIAEVERYIVWPGQALGYKVGQLRITAMRAKAEAALGSRFDVRQFHSQILRDGALPLDVLEAKIDRWIAASRGS
jgi:uncharacterized protein (DUF885 family)